MLYKRNSKFTTKLSSDSNDDFESEESNDYGVVVDEAKPEIKEPSLYNVVLLNDDYTPMDFVVTVLVSLFSKNHMQATKIMLQVHQDGKGVCGKYTSEVAETKAMQVNDFSKENGHPLIAVSEKTSS